MYFFVLNFKFWWLQGTGRCFLDTFVLTSIISIKLKHRRATGTVWKLVGCRWNLSSLTNKYEWKEIQFSMKEIESLQMEELWWEVFSDWISKVSETIPFFIKQPSSFRKLTSCPGLKMFSSKLSFVFTKSFSFYIRMGCVGVLVTQFLRREKP